jgi:hypothetical protein
MFRAGRKRPSAKMATLFDAALGAGGALTDAARAEAGLGRRSVLAGGLLAGGMLAIAPEARELLAWVERHPPQIDASAVDSLAELLAAQRRADDILGPGVMLRPALAQLAAVEDLVRQARGPARPALLDIAEQWAQFGGWLCRNTSDLSQAAMHIGHSLEWAEELGDRTMIATALLNKAEMAAYAGEAGAAVGLAQAAQRDRRAATGQRAQAAIFEARGHALAGDADAADRRLGQAQDLAAALAARPQDRRPWSYWMQPAFFCNEDGITSAYLAADPRWHARAVALLETADDGTSGGVWASAANLTWLAFAHVRADEVDQACATALAAADVVRRSGSVKCAVMLARVHADLSAQHPGDSRVAELADALRAA